MLCAQEKEIKALKEQVAIKLLAHMQEQKAGKIVLDFGTFSRAQKLVYTYSEEIKHAEQAAKEEIAKMRQAEEAKQEPEIKEYLLFRAKKS